MISDEIIGYLYCTDGPVGTIEYFSRQRCNEYMRNPPWTETPVRSAAPMPPSAPSLREALERIVALDVPINIVDVMNPIARDAVEIARNALSTQHAVAGDAHREELANEIDMALNAYLNMRSVNDGPHLEAALRQVLWDNKAGIVAYLRRPPVSTVTGTREDVARAIEILKTCRTSYCGYAITKSEQYPGVVADFYKEIERLDKAGREALSLLNGTGRS